MSQNLHIQSYGDKGLHDSAPNFYPTGTLDGTKEYKANHCLLFIY